MGGNVGEREEDEKEEKGRRGEGEVNTIRIAHLPGMVTRSASCVPSPLKAKHASAFVANIQDNEQTAAGMYRAPKVTLN